MQFVVTLLTIEIDVPGLRPRHRDGELVVLVLVDTFAPLSRCLARFLAPCAVPLHAPSNLRRLGYLESLPRIIFPIRGHLHCIRFPLRAAILSSISDLYRVERDEFIEDAAWVG